MASIYPSRTVLESIRDKAAAALEAAMTTPKPTYEIDGQTVNWKGYVEMLQAQLEKVVAMLKEIDASESGPGHVETIVV